MSDDEYVEVTSGLNEGDTIQVVTTTKQNTIRSSSNKSDKSGMSGMNGESGFERPNMPDGAGMPSGSPNFQPPSR